MATRVFAGPASTAQEPIATKHLLRGARREYQKLGKLVGEAKLEGHYGLLRTDTTAKGTST
jgi:hypothetical protein